MRKHWFWLAALLLTAACSDDKKVEQPAKLTPINATLRVDRAWSVSLGDGSAVPLRLGLGISLGANRVFAASHKGDVVAIDVNSGRILWRVHTKAPLSGGTAASAELLFVGATDGEFFAFDAVTGRNLWKVRLGGEVLAPAAIGERLVAVRTVDGKLHALNPADGHELWVQEQPVPRLSLRGTARPLISGDVVLCGFDNGKVLAIGANDGAVQWEATVTPPHGRTELERLSDVDSAVAVSGQDVFAVGFQGRVDMLALDTGQVWWSHESSSYRGLTLDGDTLYLDSSDGEVVALRARTGAEIWRQKALLYRSLTGFAVVDEWIVTGDYQGYLHFLDKATGAIVGRAATGKGRLSNLPIVSGNLVVVDSDSGQVSAWKVSRLAKPKRMALATPAPAPEPRS